MTEIEIAAHKALGQAVLETALDDLKMARAKRNQKALTEVIKWFNSDSHKFIFSFAPLCEWLGLAPSAVRRTLNLKGKV